jgi:hypothetical protein
LVAKRRFVGFQDHYEVPDPRGLVDLQVDIECGLDEVKAFSLIGEAQYLTHWFCETKSLVSKPGGKVSFVNQSGELFEGVCTSYRPGKEISILSDEFGEFHGQILHVGNQIILRIRLKSIDDNPEAKSTLFKSLIERLRVIAS